MRITEQDIDILIEAMDLWENESGLPAGIVNVIELAVQDKLEGEERAAFKDAANEYKKEQSGRKRIKKEQSIILKAKLLELKQEIGIKMLEKS